MQKAFPAAILTNLSLHITIWRCRRKKNSAIKIAWSSQTNRTWVARAIERYLYWRFRTWNICSLRVRHLRSVIAFVVAKKQSMGRHPRLDHRPCLVWQLGLNQFTWASRSVDENRFWCPNVRFAMKKSNSIFIETIWIFDFVLAFEGMDSFDTSTAHSLLQTSAGCPINAPCNCYCGCRPPVPKKWFFDKYDAWQIQSIPNRPIFVSCDRRFQHFLTNVFIRFLLIQNHSRIFFDETA